MQEDQEKAVPTLEADGGESAWLAVDEEATLLFVTRGARVAGRVVSLSMAGCRINTWEKSPPAINLRVEASFRINGIAFRFSGVTESNDGHRLVGIRFVDVASRRLDELIEVLAELSAAARKKAEKAAAMEAASPAAAQAQLPPTAIGKPGPATREILSPAPALHLLEPRSPAGRLSPMVPAVPPPAATQPPPQPTGRDRRTQSRHDVDTSATIYLVNVASRIGGRILNLSLGGCRIKTHERFPVGIYTRVETEFQIEGLSFRLGGVVQAIQDKLHVGIRFLDMSERKRGLLEQLIEEIEALHEREKSSDGRTPQ